MTGIDSSPPLIGMCKDRFPDQDWIVADMRTLSLDRRFDGILAWDSFFHLCPDDQRKMFPIFQKHAESKAALMFTSGPSHGEVIGTYKGEPLYHGSLDGTSIARYSTKMASMSCPMLSKTRPVVTPQSGWHR